MTNWQIKICIELQSAIVVQKTENVASYFLQIIAFFFLLIAIFATTEFANLNLKNFWDCTLQISM